MEIRRYVSGLIASNMYLIVDNNHAVVIDPFDDTTPGKGLVIDYILLTHEHFDHISGVNIWKEKSNAQVLCSKTCADNIKDSRKNFSRYFKDFCEIQTWVTLDEFQASDPDYTCNADITFVDNMNFCWNGHKFELFEIPGHSLGSIGIIIDGLYFFSGDSLMENFEIELRMPGGSRKKWHEIGEPRMARIPNGIKVYPGHFNEFIYQRKGVN